MIDPPRFTSWLFSRVLSPADRRYLMSDLAEEYSEIFFGSDFKVLRGGSWATRPSVARGTFRNWDYPIRRQIFAGFRCARDAE